MLPAKAPPPATLRERTRLGVEAFAWNIKEDAAPKEALSGRDAIVHLAGEDVGQRWNDKVKAEILDSRERGTRNIVHTIFDTKPRPKALICASAVGCVSPQLLSST